MLPTFLLVAHIARPAPLPLHGNYFQLFGSPRCYGHREYGLIAKRFTWGFKVRKQSGTADKRKNL
jgi:hypothetical protein